MAIFLVLLSYISLTVGQALCLVYGVSNSSTNLTSSFHPSIVKELTWKHDIKGTRYQIAKIKNSTLIENYGNRYKQFYNGTVLCINELNDNDSGLYIADVTLHDDTSKEEKIYMTVFDPIPPVRIQTKEWKLIGDRCNVTLLCHVLSNTTDFSYTWKNKQGDSEYQQYNNRSTIQISLSLDHQDTEFICIVYNPADQKNASFHVKHCLEEKTRSHHIAMVFFISMFIVVIVALPVVKMVCWKKSKRSPLTTVKGKVKDLGEDLDKNEEMKYLNEIEHTVVVKQEASDLGDQIQAQMVKEHGNEGHQDEINDHEEHVTEENECEGHKIEEHENRGSENEEHLTILVEESRDQAEVEEHENNEPENEEHLTISVEESGEQDGNNVKETENEEYLTIPVQETDHVKKLRQCMEKIEHLHEDENTGGLLQDSSDLDEQDKVEEHKKNDDYKNEDDLTLVEETGSWRNRKRTMTMI